MANGDWHDNFLWGVVAMLFTGIYTGVVKHVRGHVTQEDLAEAKDDLSKLKENVQYKDNCGEVQKRFEADSKQTHEMLVRILDKLDRINGVNG